MYGNFTSINANTWGGGASRPRNYATNICNISEIATRIPESPNWYLNNDAYSKKQSVECIVASGFDTHNPPILTKRDDDKERRYITVNEAETLQM